MPSVPVMPILTSRGCHFDCVFCSVRSFYESGGHPTWRRRSVQDVLDEINELVCQYGATDFIFVDDLFLDRSQKAVTYAEEFIDAVRQRGLSLAFTISTTVDSVDQEVFGALRDVGLRQVYLGAESASPEILKYLGKWFQPVQIERAVEILRTLGIDASVSWMNFTPASEMRHLRENTSFFSRLGVDLLPSMLNRYQVYAGTPLYCQLRDAGKLRGEFPRFDYVGTDEKVDLAYEVCTAIFKPFLDVAHELRRLTSCIRRTRFLPDEASSREDKWQPERDNSRDHGGLNDIAAGINGDAASFFEKVLCLVESGGDSCQCESVSSFAHELASDVVSCCEGWLKTLKFFDVFFLTERCRGRML